MSIIVDLLSRTEAGVPISASQYDAIITSIEASFALAATDTSITLAQDQVYGRIAAGSGLGSALTAAQLIGVLATADGTGSGLDADLLDGVEGSDFLLKTELAAGAITPAPGNFDLSGGSTGHVLTKQANGDWASQAQAGGGDMSAATYDPQGIAGDAFLRTNHTGTQSIATIDEILIDTIGSIANNEVLAFDTGVGKFVNQTAAEAGLATSAQGAFADSALQLEDVTSGILTAHVGDLNLSGGTTGQVLTKQANGSTIFAAVGSHTHVKADITDFPIVTADIAADAVTDVELSHVVTGGSVTNANITFNDQGRITAASSGSAGGGLSTVNDANTTITIGDALASTHRRLTAATAIALTLDADATIATKVAITPKAAGVAYVGVETTAVKYRLPLDAADRPTVTAPADAVWGTPSGNNVTITSAGSNLPVYAAGQLFQILNASNAANNGIYVATGTPTAASLPSTKITGTLPPVAAGAASANVLDAFSVSGYNLFECYENSGGTSAKWDIVGETSHSDTVDANIDFAGFSLLNIGGGSTFSDAAATRTALGVGSGTGDVVKVGTPVNNQLGIWTGDGTLEGDSDLTWNDTALTVRNVVITPASASGAATIALPEDTDNGTNTVTLAAPDAIASNKIVTLQDITGTVYVTGGTDIAVADGGTGGSDAATARANLELEIGTDILAFAGTGLVERISGHIETAANKTYVLDLKAPYAYTINSLAAKTVSGTCTAKLTIDGVDVTGITALAVSSTEDFDDASGANSVSVGNTVALVISSNSAALDLQFTVKVTR